MRHNIPIALVFGFGFWTFLAIEWKIPMGMCVFGFVCFIVKELVVIIREVNEEMVALRLEAY